MRKGELSPAEIDRNWPHQVAVASAKCVGRSNYIMRKFCEYRRLSLCERGHAVMYRDIWYNDYSFATPEHAGLSMATFASEPFNPADRGRGHSWNRRNKGQGRAPASRPA